MKFTKSLIFCFLTFLLTVGAYTQNITVSGKVTDEKGLPIPGVSVIIKGSNKGTSSDFDGKYQISAPKNGTLVFSFIGFNNVSETIEGKTTINAKLTGKVEDLKEVVVTSLGIKREARSLGYATQNISGKNLQTVRGVDAATSLSGKIAGLLVKNSTDFAAAPELELRGENPLIVIDGVPYLNMTFRDVPADDIESISVLKGGTATALYGTRGGSGALMITTKKGASKNGLNVTFNSGNMYSAGYLAIPEMQSTYGRLIDPLTNRVSTSGDGSWGAPMDGRLAEQWDPVSKSWVTKPYLPIGKDNFKNFIQQGYIFNNNISVVQQGELGSMRASATWVNNQGQYPNSNFDKITYSLGGEMKINNFSLSSSMTYNKQSSPNIGFNGYTAYDPMYNLLVWSSPDYDVRQMKDYWIVKDEVQNTSYTNTNNNPYFDQNERIHSYNRDIFNGTLALNYNFTPWLKGTFRTGYDTYSDHQTIRVGMGSLRSAGIATVIDGGSQVWGESQKGSFNEGLNRGFSTNNDLLLTANKTFGDFNVEAFGGTSLLYSQKEGLAAYTNGGLSIPGFYSLNASVLPSIIDARTSKYQMNSLYSRVSLSWKKMFYLEGTYRNDWSSTLPASTRSFDYPSLSGSFVISEILPKRDWLSLWKLRSSWTKGRNVPSPYASNKFYNLTNNSWGTLSSEAMSDVLKSSNLRADGFETYEFGSWISMFKKRASFDITYYNKRKYDGLVYAGVSPTSGYNAAYINTGEEITRKGIEIAALGTIIKNDSWQWDIGANWSSAADYYTKLDPIYSANKPWVQVGERADPFVIREYLRDPQGNIIHGAGKPLYSDYDSRIGYSGAKFVWGLNTTLKYKNFQFTMSVDGRVGGMTQTVTEMYMWQTGNHPDSLDPARYLDAINPGSANYIGQGVKVVSGAATYDAFGNITSDNRVYAPNDVPITYQSYIETLHKGTAWGGAPSELESYSTTFFKIREMSLTYEAPKDIVSLLHLKDVSFSVIGQNLFLYAKKFKYSDPDGGTENFSDPSIRYIGFNIKATTF